MATSGNFITSDSGQGGNGYYSRMIFEWWETGRGISGNVGYHNISYHLKSWDGSTTRWQQFYNGSMNVDGAGYSWGTTQVYGGGATVFGDYGKTLYTDTNGNRGFGASAQGGIYTNNINTSGSGSWGLDNIPLHAYLTALSTDQGGLTAYDEGPLWLEFANPANTAVDAFIELPDGSNRVYTSASGIGSRFNFPFDSGLIAKFQQATPNSNNFTVRFGIHDSNGGDSYDYRDRTYTIKNDTGQANPLFSNFTFADGNSATTAITGNNQYLVQGYSYLQVTVSTGNKAVPQKYANMDHYTVTVGSYSNDAAFSSSAAVVKDVGAVSDVSGTQVIGVKAVDSRGNSKTVTKNVTILPYAAPVVNGTLARSNGYDGALMLHVAGNVSPLTIGSTDKNNVNATSGVQYRVSMDGGAYGAWTNVTTTKAAGTGAITASADIIIAAQGSASANHNYAVDLRITDSITNTVQSMTTAQGTPILLISTTAAGGISGPGSVYYKGQLLDTLFSGPSGATGPAGSPGGATGPTGVAGPTGATGPAGATGAGVTGATGFTGATGPAGSIGATGVQGVTGVQGRTGPSGPQGTTGPTGAAGFIAQPTAPVRTDVLWVDTDDFSAMEAGATGATGPQGTPGGATGPTGQTGATGPAGYIAQPNAPARTDVIWVDTDDITGNGVGVGPTGPIGPQGATGPIGLRGIQGPAGATGATGYMGPAGATGVTGNAGATGVQGATGSQGATGAIADATTTTKGAIQLAGALAGTAASPTVPGLASKLDTTTAASTYLTQTNASSTYLTQTNAASTYAPKASPTFTGTVTLAADPASALQAATKQYVDNRTPKITPSTSAPSSPAAGDLWVQM